MVSVFVLAMRFGVFVFWLVRGVSSVFTGCREGLTLYVLILPARPCAVSCQGLGNQVDILSTGLPVFGASSNSPCRRPCQARA